MVLVLTWHLVSFEDVDVISESDAGCGGSIVMVVLSGGKAIGMSRIPWLRREMS
jgi:hypothetical protein